MVYVLYLLLARMTLDTFNCNPSEPPDPRGRTFMENAVIPCYVAGGEHMTMFPGAIGGLFLYVIGFPAFAVWLLFRNRHLIKEDQILRAMWLGHSRKTNPNAYTLRKRYGRLYYLFKPSFYFWIVVIIARKLMLATTALMFRANPTFQMSVALLVCFFAFAAQVRWQPYICAVEYAGVLKEHELKAAHGSRLHGAINNTIREVRSANKQKKRRMTMIDNPRAKQADSAHAAEATKRVARDRAAQRMADWLVNYNTLDAVLLASAAFVNLAGIMFESGRFEGESASSDSSRDLVTSIVILVIVGSIGYFVTVLGMDILVFCSPRTVERIIGRFSCCMSKALRKERQKQRRIVEQKEGEDQLGKGFTVNPMMKVDQGKDDAKKVRTAMHAMSWWQRPVLCLGKGFTSVLSGAA